MCMWLVVQQHPKMQSTGRRIRFGPSAMRLISASVSPLLALKWASGIQGVGSNLQLGAGVENSHPYMLLEHLPLECHQKKSRCAVTRLHCAPLGGGKMPWICEGPKSHISTLLPGIGNLGMDCCLKYSLKSISGNRVTSYTLQGSESGCLLRAVV